MSPGTMFVYTGTRPAAGWPSFGLENLGKPRIAAAIAEAMKTDPSAPRSHQKWRSMLDARFAVMDPRGRNRTSLDSNLDGSL